MILNQDLESNITAKITGKTLVSSGNYNGKWVYTWVQVARQAFTGTYIEVGDKQGNYFEGPSEILSAPLLELNNLEVAVGTIVKAYQIITQGVVGYEFDGAGNEPTGSGGIPPNFPCTTCGWLLDRAWHVERETVFSVRVYGGEENGRCECIQDQPPLPEDPPLQAFYDLDDDIWKLAALIHTCCGCARLELDIPGDGTMVGTLTVLESCDEGAVLPVIYPLIFRCCTPTSVVFEAGGIDLCNTVLEGYCEDLPCDPAFKIVVTCDCCALVNVECDECRETCAPSIYGIATELFTNTFSVYDGPWFLPFESDTPATPCRWELVCGDITVSMIMTRDVSDNSVVRVTYSGGPGSVVYEFTATPDDTNLICWNPPLTLARISGDAVDTPATITLEAIGCLACTDKCASVDCFEIDTDVIDTTGTCGALSIVQDPGEARCVLNLPAGWSAVFDTTFVVPGGTDRAGEHEITCTYGRLVLEFHSSGGPGFTWSYAVVSLDWDPIVFVVDITFGQEGCSSTYRVSFTQGS